VSTYTPTLSPTPNTAAPGRGWPRALERRLLFLNLAVLALAVLGSWLPSRGE
jgi:hypothetical protein